MDEKFTQLYQRVVMEHARTPHNFGEMDNYDSAGEGDNPMCGDAFKVFLSLNENIIENISFTGAGCAVSKSAASVMTDKVKGMSVEQVKQVYEQFQQLVNGEVGPENADPELGDLLAFAGIAEFPVRIKCATLAWQALMDALKI